MVNNSSKTNNRLSSQVIEHKKTTTIYDVENQCPGLVEAHKCGGVNMNVYLGLTWTWSLNRTFLNLNEKKTS